MTRHNFTRLVKINIGYELNYQKTVYILEEFFINFSKLQFAIMKVFELFVTIHEGLTVFFFKMFFNL